MRGKFITLEGMDGAGKSTHIPFILSTLRSRGLEVVSTREPGGTPLGESLRELLLHQAMHPETETLLMFAARLQHINEIIEPALARGAWVLSDRYTDATFAYQCGGRGVSATKVEQLEQWVQGSLQPDLTLLFDVPVEISAKRLAGAREPDKFEQESIEFFSRIRENYLARAREYPQRFHIVDADRTIEKIENSLEDIILTI
jgi:dTMP kinase